MQLKTEGVARLLNQNVETVREMLRTKSVSWGVFIPPKKARHGRGQYVYYPERFAKDTGIALKRVKEAMQ